MAILSGGRIVTQGRPRDLARPGGVVAETAAGTRSYEGAGREEIPGIVRELVADGQAIYRVDAVTDGLEDVYVEAMREREP